MSVPKPSKKYKKALGHISGTDVGALVEEFTSQVKFVGEQVVGLDKKVGGLEGKMDRMESKMDKIETDIEVIKMDISVIKNDLKNKVSRDEFALLERRVALLENRTKVT